MKQKFKIRHEILVYLFNKLTYNKYDAPELKSTITSLKDVAKGINRDYELVYMQHHMLPEEQA